MSKSELIDIARRTQRRDKKAFLIYDGKTTAWVPKSQVEDNKDGSYTMPQWLAQEKGFI